MVGVVGRDSGLVELGVYILGSVFLLFGFRGVFFRVVGVFFVGEGFVLESW